MDKQIKILPNGNIQIENVILTEKALETIAYFQDENETSINIVINDLSDAICLLIMDAANSSTPEEEMQRNKAALSLCFLRNNLKDMLIK